MESRPGLAQYDQAAVDRHRKSPEAFLSHPVFGLAFAMRLFNPYARALYLEIMHLAAKFAYPRASHDLELVSSALTSRLVTYRQRTYKTPPIRER